MMAATTTMTLTIIIIINLINIISVCVNIVSVVINIVIVVIVIVVIVKELSLTELSSIHFPQGGGLLLIQPIDANYLKTTRNT